jgi:hypothetical protein
VLPGRKPLLWTAGIFLLALGVIVGRLLIDGRALGQRGAQAENHGHPTEAIRLYAEAARHYVPFGPYHAQALSRLDAIAVSAIQRGDYPLGRMALEAERSALLATRSLYIPMAHRLPEIELRLARLLAATEDPATQAGASFEDRSRWHLDRLSQHPSPRGPYVLLALVGLGGLVASSVLFFTRGLDVNLRLKSPWAIVYGSLFLLGLGLFLAGLRWA